MAASTVTASQARPAALPAAASTSPAPATVAGRRLPPGIRMSDVWRSDKGELVGPAKNQVPVDPDYRLAGQLYLCPLPDCGTREWLFDAPTEAPCCTRHPARLVAVRLDVNGDPDTALTAARAGLNAGVRRVLLAKRDAVQAAAKARVDAAWKAAEDATRRTAADMRGHVPSLLVATGVLGGVAYLYLHVGALLTAAAGGAVAVAGPVLAYAVAYPILATLEKRRSQGKELAARKGRRARRRAWQIAFAALLAGVWTVGVALLGVDPATWAGRGVWVAGCVLTWVAARSYWEDLWAEVARLKELRRLKLEAAARRAEEEAAQPVKVAGPAFDENDPLQVGARLAERWSAIAQSATVPQGFKMALTRIVVEETRPVTIPDDTGLPVRIGWEFAGVSEPGALVGRPGTPVPLIAAADWIASMLDRDPSTMSVVDRPVDDQGRARPNRFLIVLTDSAPLGAYVPWKAAAGVRRGNDGTVSVHTGRTLLGSDVFEALYSPGQPFGGLTVGTTGGGKTAGTVLELLNCLAAGILPVLHDPKNLVDYPDFIGVFPIGVTIEHAHVIIESLVAERRRRERLLASRPMIDRHGRVRAAEAVWNPATDGPPILSVWEEFHSTAKYADLINAITQHVRFQRAAAMGLRAVTQGGGLADLANSDIRGLLQTTGLRLYRMADNLARLAGYTGVYLPSQLPRVPGACLAVTEQAPAVPLRGAYVTREDVDGCVFDQLYAPDMTPLLTAPTLPAETVATFERTGLMDLWRAGQGRNGLTNLMSDTSNYAPVGELPVATGGQKVAAADVILAVLAEAPGAGRADIDASPIWLTAPGWGKPANPSTVSRAVAALLRDGHITRVDNVHNLTEKGHARAASASAAMPAGGSSAGLQAKRRDNAGGYLMSVLTRTLTGEAMTLVDIEEAFALPGWPFDRDATLAMLAENVGAGLIEESQPGGYRVTRKFADQIGLSTEEES